VAMAVREHGLADKLGAGYESERFTIRKGEIEEGSGKLLELLKLLRGRSGAAGKTLVFSQYTQFLDLVGEAFVSAGIKYFRLDGTTAVRERAMIVRAFQRANSGVDVFLLSTKAGGLGLNLTAADCVVLLDLSFNPHDNRQAEDRVHRLGQTRPVKVHYLVCSDSVEEAVLRVNLKKMALDYQFGGQRTSMTIQDSETAEASKQEDERGQQGDAARHVAEDEEKDDDRQQDEDEEDEEGEEEQEPALDLKRDGKRAEEEVLAELEQACMKFFPLEEAHAAA